ASASVEMAYNLDAELIVGFTSSGTTALRVSRNRPPTPPLAITPTARAQRPLAVAWGLVAYQTDHIHDPAEVDDTAPRATAPHPLLEPGDRYVVTAGVPFGMRGTTNLVRVERYRPPEG